MNWKLIDQGKKVSIRRCLRLVLSNVNAIQDILLK